MSGEKKTKYGEPVNSGPLPSYDPKPAAKLAAGILRDARAPFAIIGRVAMWTYLPPEQLESVLLAHPTRLQTGSTGGASTARRPLAIAESAR